MTRRLLLPTKDSTINNIMVLEIYGEFSIKVVCIDIRYGNVFTVDGEQLVFQQHTTPWLNELVMKRV